MRDEVRSGVIQRLPPSLFENEVIFRNMLGDRAQQAVRPVGIQRRRHRGAAMLAMHLSHLRHQVSRQRTAASMGNRRADSVPQGEILGAEVGVLEHPRDVRMAGHADFIEAGNESALAQTAAVAGLQIIEGVAHTCSLPGHHAIHERATR